MLLYAIILTANNVQTLAPIALPAKQMQIECRMQTSDECCSVGISDHLSPLDALKVLIESHNAKPGRTREGSRMLGYSSASSLSIISECHDSRPDPLPEESPLRILNAKVGLYCPAAKIAKILMTTLLFPFIDPDTKRLVTESKKGWCEKDPERTMKAKIRDHARYERTKLKRLQAGLPACPRRPRTKQHKGAAVPELESGLSVESESDQDTDQMDEMCAVADDTHFLCQDSVRPTESLPADFEVMYAALILASISTPSESTNHREYDRLKPQ